MVLDGAFQDHVLDFAPDIVEFHIVIAEQPGYFPELPVVHDVGLSLEIAFLQLFFKLDDFLLQQNSAVAMTGDSLFIKGLAAVVG